MPRSQALFFVGVRGEPGNEAKEAMDKQQIEVE